MIIPCLMVVLILKHFLVKRRVSDPFHVLFVILIVMPLDYFHLKRCDSNIVLPLRVEKFVAMVV